MKIQDLGFAIIFLLLLWKRDLRLISLIGLICLVLAMPLFAFWVFFTAQRLVMYGAALILLSIFLSSRDKNYNHYNNHKNGGEK